MEEAIEKEVARDRGRLDVPEEVRERAHHISGLANRLFGKMGHHWATEATYEAALDELVLLAEDALTLRRRVLIARDEARLRI